MPRTTAVPTHFTHEQIISMCLEYESVYDKKIVSSTQYKQLPLGMMFVKLMDKYYRATIPVTTARAMLAIKTVYSMVTKRPYSEDPECRIKFIKECRKKGLNVRKQIYNGCGGQACINWLRRHYDSLTPEQQMEVNTLCKTNFARTDELYQLVYQYETHYGPVNYRTIYQGKEIGRFLYRQIAKYHRTKDDKIQKYLEKSITYKQRQSQ